MKIERYEKLGQAKYRLFLDNGEVIDICDDVILKYELLFKKEISKEMYVNILIDSNLSDYYNSCVKYISLRVRSIKEIKDYLRRKQVSDEDIEAVVERLIRDGYLDDNYFCECFIKDKLRFTTMGTYRIINELKKHNIDNEIIASYSDLLSDEVMEEKMIKLVQKQLSSKKKLDMSKFRNKLYHQLIGLGYPSSLVVQVLNELLVRE